MCPVAWLTLEGIAVAALVMTSKLPAPTQPQETKAIGPDNPDTEVMTLIEAHIFDPERWEKECIAPDTQDQRELTGRIRAARDEFEERTNGAPSRTLRRPDL
jgi:hypothetical protein